MPLTTDQLIAQSKAMLAQTAAEGTKAFAGSSYDTVKPTTPTITASSLEPKTARQPFTTPPETPIPDLSYLTQKEPTLPNPANTPSTLGTTETQYKNMLAELMGTNTALEGKAGYTAQQNEALGVNAASDAITGLNSQLTGLINESKAIPLQIQQSAQEGGANVTKGGLAPIQTASLRNNAIQSLSVSSQIDAMNGQLSNAIKKVDRAVALKYGDLEARSATLTRNLELLAKDPSLTLEQQDRVAKKLVEQKAYDAQLADQKQTETETHDARLKVLSNNTGNPKLTQQIIEVLQSAQTPEEVAALVNYYGLSVASQADQLDMKVKQAQLDKANYDLANPNRQTQVIEGANGNTLLIDTNTGTTIKDYGAKKAVVDTKAPEVKTINGVDKQWNSSTQEWEDIGSQNGEVSKKISDQLNLLDLSITNAEKYAGASGRSGIRKTVEGVTVGATDYTNLEAQINTLKTNMLTLATDPSIKKFFGPQMSNADVRLMMSAATPADPELQDPATLKAELARLKTAVTTMKELANPGSTPGGQMYQNLVTAPDGTRVIITD